MYRITWRPEAYEGVGPANQACCSIPHCGNVVDSRGLCFTCYQSWRRGGMDGLRQRALRVLEGRNVQVPLDEDKAIEMLADAIEAWEIEEEEDVRTALKQRVLRIAAQAGTIERRKRWCAYGKAWRERNGVQAPGALGRGQKAS